MFALLFTRKIGKGQLTSENYPCDLDTTSLAWTTLKKLDDNAIHAVMDEMLKYRNSDGILEVSSIMLFEIREN